MSSTEDKQRSRLADPTEPPDLGLEGSTSSDSDGLDQYQPPEPHTQAHTTVSQDTGDSFHLASSSSAELCKDKENQCEAQSMDKVVEPENSETAQPTISETEQPTVSTLEGDSDVSAKPVVPTTT